MSNEDIPTSRVWFCSSYYGWDHMAIMLCENWILWLIPDLNRNNKI
jgi:hypothetical protein